MTDASDSRPDRHRPDPSRRAFLIAAAGVGAAVGGVASALVLLARDGIAAPPDPAPTSSPPVVAVEGLLSEHPFRIAHRGGSDDWPEMTRYAYQRAVARGYEALEMSVARTADGVWFGSHDATLDRLSGTSGFVAAEHTWAEVGRLRVAAPATSTGVPPQPYLALRDFLAEFAAARVVFLDPKASDNRFYPELLDQIASAVPHAAARVVAKSPGADVAWARLAHAKGLRTWGFYYAADVESGLLQRTATEWDLLGLDVTAPPAMWATVVAMQKPVIAHVLHTVEDDRRALALGAVGEIVAGVMAIRP